VFVAVALERQRARSTSDSHFAMVFEKSATTPTQGTGDIRDIEKPIQ
jgi:hypothetical protein